MNTRLLMFTAKLAMITLVNSSSTLALAEPALFRWFMDLLMPLKLMAIMLL